MTSAIALRASRNYCGVHGGLHLRHRGRQRGSEVHAEVSGGDAPRHELGLRHPRITHAAGVGEVDGDPNPNPNPNPNLNPNPNPNPNLKP